MQAPGLTVPVRTNRPAPLGHSFVGPPPELPRALSAAVCWVPSEYVYIGPVSLPLKHAAKREKALPFAIEPHLGVPIQTVHVALGGHLADQNYIAAAVDLALMRSWDGQAAGSVLLVPDIFMLPRPAVGKWAIAELEGRVLVRLADGGGFATDLHAFEALFEAAGRPTLHLLWGKLPAPAEASGASNLPWPARSDLLDLRQGVFAQQRHKDTKRRTQQLQAGSALVMGVTLVSAADIWALTNIRNTQIGVLSASYAERFPGASPGDRLLSDVQALTSRSAGAQSGDFVSSLSAVFSSLGTGTGLSVQTLRYDHSAGQLELQVEAGSIDTLQAAAARLKSSGIAAEISSASTIPGGAEGRLTIVFGAVAQ